MKVVLLVLSISTIIGIVVEWLKDFNRWLESREAGKAAQPNRPEYASEAGPTATREPR